MNNNAGSVSYLELQGTHVVKPYTDSYAIYAGGDEATNHPEWILKDVNGIPLYIPFDIPKQFAADIGNPDWWAHMASWLLDSAAKNGNRGVAFDDVNLLMKVSDGAYNPVQPMDPRTKKLMTQEVWDAYFISYLTALKACVRAIYPTYSFMLNSPWFVSPTGVAPELDPVVKKEWAVADMIQKEQAFYTDKGITGGEGFWSLYHLFLYADKVHASGLPIFWNEYTADGLWYSLACYFLILETIAATGLKDQICWGSPQNLSVSPFDRILALNLGDPKGPRQRLGSITGRAYTGGMVLVNDPGAPTQVFTLPQAMTNVETGARVSVVTLGQKQGVVLTI